MQHERHEQPLALAVEPDIREVNLGFGRFG
jgi:hypothetical protein